MTRTRVIRVFSFIMALTLVFAMFSAPSYAFNKQQLGAWIASALTAINIGYESTVAPYLQFVDYLVDPFQINESQVVEYVPYTYNDIDDILSQSTLSFKGEKVIIDGKEYTDIWLSNDAAQKFRTNAFDLKDAWNIASQSEGTYVSGTGNYAGIPVFDINSSYKSQFYSLPPVSGSYRIGNILFSVTINDTTSTYKTFTVSATFPDSRIFTANGTFYTNWSSLRDHGAAVLNNNCLAIDSWGDGSYPNGYFASHADLGDASYFNNQPFDFDWVASEIPAEEIMPSDYGLHLRVPTDPSEWVDDPDTQQVINNYNDFIENNPELSPDVDLDLSDPDILDKISDLLDILRPILKLLNPEFSPKDSEPTPPTPPEPTGTISNEPWSSLRDILNNIIQKIDDLIDSLPTLDIDLSGIKNVLDSILKEISDLVDKLLDHDADWFSDVVDSIKQPFLRWFSILKSGVGIWHYVVEWLQYISSPFTFFFGILNNLGGIYVSPFYAVAAACIVIAIYRRFGR